MRLSWLTDIHLDFLRPHAIRAFARRVAGDAPDGVLISGDIGQGPSVAGLLRQLAEELRKPVYFVLGNHDFYGSSIAGVRARMRQISGSENLFWLPHSRIVGLTARSGLVGHDSWADGRLGSYETSPVVLNDCLLIEELLGADRAGRLQRLHELGDEAAAFFRAVLPEAFSRFDHVLALMHPPPFREACRFMGRITSDAWLPHLACDAVGRALREIMGARPDKALLVLCGHTHGASDVRILPNLIVKTGGASYRSPEIQQVIEVT